MKKIKFTLIVLFGLIFCGSAFALEPQLFNKEDKRNGLHEGQFAGRQGNIVYAYTGNGTKGNNPPFWHGHVSNWDAGIEASKSNLLKITSGDIGNWYVLCGRDLFAKQNECHISLANNSNQKIMFSFRHDVNKISGVCITSKKYSKPEKIFLMVDGGVIYSAPGQCFIGETAEIMFNEIMGGSKIVTRYDQNFPTKDMQYKILGLDVAIELMKWFDTKLQ